MNSDIRISVTFAGHRKRKKLKQVLGEDGSGYLIDLWINTALNHPSGILTGMDETDIALDAGWEKDPAVFVHALVAVKLIDRRDDGFYELHDWETHQPFVCHAPARAERAKNAAEKRWGTKKETQQYQGDNAYRMPAACQPHANSNAPSPTPTPTPKELTTPPPPPLPGGDCENFETLELKTAEEISTPDQPDPPAAKNKCPHQEIIDTYHSICPMLPKIRDVTSSLTKRLSARWREKTERKSLAWWEGYLKNDVAASDYLTGKINDWCADLFWLTGPENMTKVLNGRYRNKDQPQKMIKPKTIPEAQFLMREQSARRLLDDDEEKTATNPGNRPATGRAALPALPG